jgi:hypothetical protein
LSQQLVEVDGRDIFVITYGMRCKGAILQGEKYSIRQLQEVQSEKRVLALGAPP